MNKNNYTHVCVVNYTPHVVTLLDNDNNVKMKFHSCGIARCAEIVQHLPALCWDPFGDSGMMDSLPIVKKEFGQVDGLPDPKPNVMYIVSQIVVDACPDRCDLLVPHDIVRGPDGQIIGNRAFSAKL